MRLGLVVAASVTVLVGASAAWFFLGAPLPWPETVRKDEPPPLKIHVATASESEVEETVGYTATVVSPQVAELHPRVSGVIMQRPLQPGSQVERGDLLFLIDPRPFETSLAEHMAQRAQAEAALQFARQEVERFRPLERRGFTSEEKLQKEIRDRDTAAGQVNEADARIMRDRLDVEYTRIVAPFTGRVGITNVNVGDLAVADQTVLVSLAQFDPIDVQVALSSADIARVREAMAAGTPVEVALLGPSGEPTGRAAKIVEFDNQFNPRTVRMLVRARLPNPDLALAPGDFLHVSLRLGKKHQLLVPTEALSYRLNQQIVYVVSDGAVQPKIVEGVRQFGPHTAITKGLEPGQQIATDHLGRLTAGQRVTVIDEPGGTAEQANARD